MYRAYSCAIGYLEMDQIIVVNKLTCAHNDIDKTHHSTYPETFAHVSPYFDNPLLLKEFIIRKLVKGEFWNIFSAIILTLLHATVISVRHDCIFYTRGLALVTKVHDVNPRWLLCDKGECNSSILQLIYLIQVPNTLLDRGFIHWLGQVVCFKIITIITITMMDEKEMKTKECYKMTNLKS